MKNKTILMAAVLAVAIVITAGLTVLPSTLQEAQANPCADQQIGETNNEGEGNSQTNIASSFTNSVDDRECNFIGNFEGAFDED